MRFCYIDESGDTAMLPSPTTNVQPAIVICGVVLDGQAIQPLTLDFIRLKQRFFPGLMPQASLLLDWILAEAKGSEIRKNVGSNNRRERTGAIGFLDKTVDLMERHHARLIARVWVKGIGAPIDGNALYTSSIQALCADFQHLLAEEDDVGIVIADSRTKAQNAQVAHSIFTRKFKSAGDGYDRILEMPVFGHSDNHAGIQLADMLCSGLLFPMTMDAYCTGHVANVHIRPAYSMMRPRWGERLKRLQHRYQDPTGQWRGGFTVSDPLAGRPGSLLFS